MKNLILPCIAFWIGVCAAATPTNNTFIGLNNPDMKQRWVCAGTSFEGDVVLGTCQLSVPAPARYVQSARYQYAANWDAATGAVVLGALKCYSPPHLGVDHSGCPQMVTLLDTNEVVVLEGMPFWYVTSNAQGAELLHTQTGSLVFYP